MMKFKQISRLGDEEFRRLTGVKCSTFKRMTEILVEAEDQRRKAKQIVYRRTFADGARISAGISDIFSYCTRLWDQRKCMLS
ncbi:MAG: hypothetical protein PG981_000700 [Wolbachia endosymbiont of Ctenocephalides orientis wCori]|nr:MAG: hypothetical protein PG981_000700 [Wolbachia endosymbiont of Ctenocephalides orientis wCori]